MANQSPEPKKNKELLEFLYLKHGLNLKDNDTSIRSAKYDQLVTEYNTRVNGNYDKKVLKKFFDNQKEIKKRMHKKEELALESNDILHSDLQNSEE